MLRRDLQPARPACFDDTYGCPDFLRKDFVAYNHPLVAGVVPSFDEECSARLLFLSELGEGPEKGKDSREEAWPAEPRIVSAAGILRWLHSAQLGAMSVTIHCSGGATDGEVRTECDVLFCCYRHLEAALPVVMRLSRERPLAKNSFRIFGPVYESLRE
ncbi:hypothetical protein FOL46_000319 [Perkinsus olseni]|uniref:Uncharacterized protein n=1 Tax=Perkinsus olseni TaxID=32597 RepID=A0A7J6KXX9_PEROL|nr:hypothetical protein FOL46_000319 [Perkinsus olseni]